jgi:hypothetical protein
VRLRLRLALVSLLTLCVASFSARADDFLSFGADDPDFLEVQGGAFDINHAHTAAFGLEYRSDYKLLWILKPMVGGMATARGGVYGYAGFAVDLHLGERIVLTGSEAIGAYGRGNDVNLGRVAPEFRSAIEAAYRFDDDSRLGVLFHHISNAGTGHKNPGAETLMLTYAYPVPKLLEQVLGKSE